MSYLTESGTSNRKMTALGLAVIVHVFIIYALLTGLASDAYKKIQQATQATEIKVEKPKEEPPPPPPEKLQEIPVVTPPPIVNIQQDRPPPPTITTVISTQTKVAPSNAVTTAPPPPRIEPAPPPKPAVPAVNASAKGKHTDWFSNDDYPESAKREGFDRGTTTVSLAISEQGRVENCTVTAPSGNDALDQTTCRLFQRRGRYNPARAVGGTPIKQTITDRVTWVLPKE